jgi:hypothetical protein
MPSSPNSIRDQVAAVAARFIAEDGLDYAGAKERAMREVLGDLRQGAHDCLPDNARVQEAVREHQGLFMADTQPARLLALRRVARDVLRFVADADAGCPLFVTGAVVNGTAGDHSDVHLLAHSDNAKDLEIFLVNAGVDYDVNEIPGSRGGETLSFLWPQRSTTTSRQRTVGSQEAVHLAVVDPRTQRGAATVDRADLAGLERLIGDSPEPT